MNKNDTSVDAGLPMMCRVIEPDWQSRKYLEEDSWKLVEYLDCYVKKLEQIPYLVNQDMIRKFQLSDTIAIKNIILHANWSSRLFVDKTVEKKYAIVNKINGFARCLGQEHIDIFVFMKDGEVVSFICLNKSSVGMVRVEMIASLIPGAGHGSKLLEFVSGKYGNEGFGYLMAGTSRNPDKAIFYTRNGFEAWTSYATYHKWKIGKSESLLSSKPDLDRNGCRRKPSLK